MPSSQLPPPPQHLLHPPLHPFAALQPPPTWGRKAYALALHAGSFVLFVLLVVWPVVAPLVDGALVTQLQPSVQSVLDRLLEARGWLVARLAG